MTKSDCMFNSTVPALPAMHQPQHYPPQIHDSFDTHMITTITWRTPSLSLRTCTALI